MPRAPSLLRLRGERRRHGAAGKNHALCRRQRSWCPQKRRGGSVRRQKPRFLPEVWAGW